MLKILVKNCAIIGIPLKEFTKQQFLGPKRNLPVIFWCDQLRFLCDTKFVGGLTKNLSTCQFEIVWATASWTLTLLENPEAYGQNIIYKQLFSGHVVRFGQSKGTYRPSNIKFTGPLWYSTQVLWEFLWSCKESRHGSISIYFSFLPNSRCCIIIYSTSAPLIAL